MPEAGEPQSEALDEEEEEEAGAVLAELWSSRWTVALSFTLATLSVLYWVLNLYRVPAWSVEQIAIAGVAAAFVLLGYRQAQVYGYFMEYQPGMVLTEYRLLASNGPYFASIPLAAVDAVTVHRTGLVVRYDRDQEAVVMAWRGRARAFGAMVAQQAEVPLTEAERPLGPWASFLVVVGVVVGVVALALALAVLSG